MAVKRDWKGNSTAREKVPTGYGLVENEPDQELAAMEQLPRAPEPRDGRAIQVSTTDLFYDCTGVSIPVDPRDLEDY